MNSLLIRTHDLAWRELHLPRPLDEAGAVERIRALACDPHAPLVVLEIRGSGHQVRYLVGTEKVAMSRVVQHLGAVAVRLSEPRHLATTARRLTISDRQRPLSTDAVETAVAAVLAALAACGKNEELVLQVVLGPRLSGLVVPGVVKQPLPLRRLLVGGDEPTMDAESRTALVKKVAEPGFAAAVRIGVTAHAPARRQMLALGLLGGLRRLESPGVRLFLADEKPERLGAGASVAAPWRWPLRLNIREIAAVAALPVGEEELPGLPPLHPKSLPPVEAVTKQSGLLVGQTTAPGTDGRQLRLSPDALLRHLHVIGPTGVGKSVLLEHLVLEHVRAGHGAVVIEPKGDLVRALLARIPEERRDDVVLLDPSAKQVVGLNLLASSNTGADRPELRADAILHVFADLFSADIGPRSTDILHSALLTLAASEGTSLVQIPRLLSDVAFRSRLVGKVADDPLLAGFWAAWEALTPTQQNSIAAPLMNKLRYVLLRPSIRAVLDQTRPKFDVAQVFTESKILLVPLPVATLGAEGSALLGSLVVSGLWNAAQGRSLLPVEQRRPVMVCLDEFQNYCRLPDIEDALATSRSLGVGWVLAHQFLDQLPASTRAAVAANVRSRVAFQLARDDAVTMAKTSVGSGNYELSPADFMALRPFHVYASLLADGQVQPFASGRTLPPDPECTDPDELAAYSARRYGRSPEEMAEADDTAGGSAGQTIETLLASETDADGSLFEPVGQSEPVGSRRRRQRQKKRDDPQRKVPLTEPDTASVRPSDRSTVHVDLDFDVPAGHDAKTSTSSHASSLHRSDGLGSDLGNSEGPDDVVGHDEAVDTESDRS